MWFEAILGLRVSLDQSKLIPMGRVENIRKLANEFGYKVKVLPCTYLSLPLGAPIKSVAV